jgi:A/G-specific adenine glycosylase
MNHSFSAKLLSWFDQHGRHDLPWQHPRTPYRVWISEIMLQQTQVKTVIPYFENFMREFPSLQHLANAHIDQVIRMWAGLGYYTRAKNLHRAAKQCIELHQGKLPENFDDILALPGIGRSTAGAILAQAHGLPFAIVDGNVRRTLARYYGLQGWPGLPAVDKQCWELSEKNLPKTRLADYTQAIMDFGATLCTRSKPGCLSCPLQKNCHAFQNNCTDQLPAKKPRKAVPFRETQMLVLLTQANEILLQRRPAKGVWSDMWSLPETSRSDEHVHLLHAHARHNNIEYAAEELESFEHVFSHYRLLITPFVWRSLQPRSKIRDGDQYRWQALDQIDDIGLPTPVKKIIESIRRPS